MYWKSGSNGNISKMATVKNRVIKYKPISGGLHKHFGFELLADGNIKNADKIYCIPCDKSFAYHGSNTSLTHHLQNKHATVFETSARSHLHLAILQRHRYLPPSGLF